MIDPNPYAPPEIIDEPPGGINLWYVEGNKIFVRDGAILPRIELETGETGEHLVATKRDFTKFPIFWPVGLFIIIGTISFFGKTVPAWMTIAGAAVIGMVFTQISHRWLPASFSIRTIRFHVGRSPASNRIRNRHILISFSIFMGSLVLAVAIANLRWQIDGHALALICLGIGAAGSFAAGAYHLLTRRDIRMSAGPNEWVILKGASPMALTSLQEFERTHKASSTSEPESPDQS